MKNVHATDLKPGEVLFSYRDSNNEVMIWSRNSDLNMRLNTHDHFEKEEEGCSIGRKSEGPRKGYNVGTLPLSSFSVCIEHDNTSLVD